MLALTRGTKVPARFGWPRSVYVHSGCPVILTSYLAGGGRSSKEEVNVHRTFTPILLLSTFAKCRRSVRAALYYARAKCHASKIH